MSSNSIFPISKQSIIVNPSSRLIIKLPVNTFDSGITGGDVIRFDTVGNKYKKSLADTPSNAEVFGIVENINSDKSANVVINGSINYPESKLVDKAVVGEEINLGGNDIYFLSGYTAGLLENKITDDKIVIKPVLQKALHGAYNGIFRNYLGYKQGNLNSIEIQALEFFISFSDDLTKLITISETLDKLFVYSISYSSLVFTTTLLDTIKFNTLSGDSIEWNIETTDAKISNNGYDILIFTKQNNKIFHINRQSGIQLKAQIDADLTGNAVDKLWAVDDELSSIAISTVAMNRDPDPDDMKLTSRDVTSRIKYLRRKPDGKNKFNWSIVNEHTVPGFLLANPFPALPKQDSLGLVLGVFRANNIKCKGKNYILTTKCLIQDQKDYKSAANGPRSSKYNNSQFDYIDLYSKTITYKIGSNIDASNNPIYASLTIKDHNIFIDNHTVYTTSGDAWYSASNIDASNLTPKILTAFQDDVNNKKYKCYFGIKNFKILNKKNNKYLDDPSCLGSNSFAYYHPIEFREGHYRNDFESFYPSGITFLTKLTPQTRNLSRINASQYNQNALFSSGSCSDTFFIIGLLYESIDTTNNDISKKFVVLKFPLNSYENDSVFDYFQYSTTYSSVIPSMTGYGIISSFYTDTFSETKNFWTAPSTNTKGPITDNPTFPMDTQLTSVNINQLNSFELHTSNDRYFLCTSTYTLIWTYSSGTYVIKDIADLDQYKFSYSGDGEFFIKNNKILRYDSGTQEFINITVV
jgi:hypothetical protein